MKTTNDNFQRTHEYNNPIATAIGEFVELEFVVNICVESVYATVSVYDETERALV